MDTSGTGQVLSQVTVQGAQARLAGLTAGAVYRVAITDLLPGKVEFLLGNQYLLASTNLRFNAGDVVNLRLMQNNPELLVFQLALPATASTEQYSADLATLLRAANLPATEANQQAVAMLLRSGISVSNRSVEGLTQLLTTYPPEVLAGFMPLYKELIDRELRLSAGVMRQLVQLPQAAPELAGLLAGALGKLQAGRVRGRTGSRQLEDAVEAALARFSEEDELPTAQALKEQLRLLYGSPERALRDAILAARRRQQEAQADAATDPQAKPPKRPVPTSAAEPALLEVEFTDLYNLVAGQRVPAELAQALELLQALRVKSAVTKDTQALLPLTLDGEPATAQLSITVLAEQYYQKDYAVRLRVSGASQGEVEIQLRTRGPGLYVDIVAAEAETAEAYRARLDEFAAELPETGFLPRRLDAGVGLR
jgi:hypothetical protein